MSKLISIIISMIILLGATQCFSQESVNTFTIYRWVQRINNLPQYIQDLPEVVMLDANQFFDKKEGGGLEDEVNIDKTIKKAQNMSTNPNYLGQMRIIDIEHLPHFSLDVDERLLAQKKIGTVIDIMKKYDGGHCYGAYMTLVERNYFVPWNHYRAYSAEPGTFWALRKEPYKEDYDLWRVRNSHARWGNKEHTDTVGLADKIDVACPSLYTFYRNTDKELMKDANVKLWPVFAEYNIREARKNEKRVIPMIMLMYHNHGAYKNHWIEPEFLKLQLDTIKKYADGVVIYQWGNEKNELNVDFDENWPWVKVVEKFIEENK